MGLTDHWEFVCRPRISQLFDQYQFFRSAGVPVFPVERVAHAALLSCISGRDNDPGQTPTRQAGTWHHWAAYDIPADLTSLPEGAAQRPWQRDFKQAVNDFERSGYGGPCPPRDHGLHHYHFPLLALSIQHLGIGKDPSCNDIEREARKHVLTEATLIGFYER
jgi:Raf kinase inhibitor-like YbhB/YbcL family protein